MTGSRWIVLALLIVSLGLFLLNLTMVVDVLRIQPPPPDHWPRQGLLSAVQSPHLALAIEDIGRTSMAVGVSLVLVPLWLTALIVAFAVYVFRVRPFHARELAAFNLARNRTDWTWRYIVEIGSRLASAQDPENSEVLFSHVRRDLTSHLQALDEPNRRRLAEFFQILGLIDEIDSSLCSISGRTVPDDVGPVEGAAEPLVPFLAVVSAFLLAWGTLAGLGASPQTFLGVYFGPHETSIGMALIFEVALLAACSASGLRRLSRQAEATSRERREVLRLDRQRYLEEVEHLLDALTAVLPTESMKAGRESFASKVAGAVVVLLSRELDGPQRGRLVRFLADRRLLDGSIEVAGASLRGATLEAADLPGARLAGVDLSHADLSGALLASADLRGARLEFADLSRTDLRGADLYRAVLWSTRLQGADLRDTRLVESALDGANLWNAALTGADLTGARVSPQQLEASAFPPASGETA